MEQEFIQNQEIKKPREEQNDVSFVRLPSTPFIIGAYAPVCDA